MGNSKRYDVVVIGGGLAGCSAAIQLAEGGRRVLLLEKQRYPAHKLCGEFLSVEVLEAFERLGLREAVWSAGAHAVRRVVATAPDGTAFSSTLPGTALGLSRYTLDHLLFERARAAGVDARDGVAVRAVAGSLQEGFEVDTPGDRHRARVVLGAYGKRGLLDRKLGRAFLARHEPLVAFKAHYEGVDLPETIELHAFPGGYCGLVHIEAGRVNACWIAHERALRGADGRPEAMVERSLTENPVLADRLRSMRRVSDAFQAVSQISFARKGKFDGDLCMIGDTAGMIAPVCGDGMAMALRAADLAVPLTAAYLEGRLTAAAFRAQYTKAWDDAFGVRLRLGRWMHEAYSQPLVAGLALRMCRLLPGLGRWLIRKTRG